MDDPPMAADSSTTEGSGETEDPPVDATRQKKSVRKIMTVLKKNPAALQKIVKALKAEGAWPVDKGDGQGNEKGDAPSGNGEEDAQQAQTSSNVLADVETGGGSSSSASTGTE
jgi:hypothetical protein